MLPLNTTRGKMIASCSLLVLSSLLQVVNSLFQTCSDNLEQAMPTQLVNIL